MSMARSGIEYRNVCPKCRMNSGMNCQLSKIGNSYVCAKDSNHRFVTDKNGFLTSAR